MIGCFVGGTRSTGGAVCAPHTFVPLGDGAEAFVRVQRRRAIADRRERAREVEPRARVARVAGDLLLQNANDGELMTSGAVTRWALNNQPMMNRVFFTLILE